MIAHVHPQGDAHQTTRRLPELRALLPTSWIQVLSLTFITHLQRCFDGGGNFSCAYFLNLRENIPGDIKHRNQNIGDMGTSNIMKKIEFVETFTFGRFYSNVRKKWNSQNVQKRTEPLVVGKAVQH